MNPYDPPDTNPPDPKHRKTLWEDLRDGANLAFVCWGIGGSVLIAGWMVYSYWGN